jgi:hypothetical protein
MMPLIWFGAVSFVAILVWRLRVNDKNNKRKEND